MWQTTRTEAYEAALLRLPAYACSCSRREVGDSVYPGTCRNGVKDPTRPVSWRVRVPDEVVSFEDRLLGHYEQHLAHEVGDFVVRRSDGLFAYQLAVVVDDDAQEITDIVRGADLLDSTPRQILLQRLLGFTTPSYLHIPVATNAAGEKLSKQTLAPPLDDTRPLTGLQQALRFLGQDVPDTATPRELVKAAIARWDPLRIPRTTALPESHHPAEQP